MAPAGMINSPITNTPGRSRKKMIPTYGWIPPPPTMSNIQNPIRVMAELVTSTAPASVSGFCPR